MFVYISRFSYRDFFSFLTRRMNEATVTVVFGLLQFFICIQDNCIAEYISKQENLEQSSFDPTLGSCYEVYDQHENVTSLTCQKPLDPEKYSCIDLILGDNHCLGMRTPTNETITFFCGDSIDDLFSYRLLDELNTCFNVSKNTGITKEVCQEKIDNHSIGIRTPDNFTILLYSRFCSTSTSNEEQEMYDDFMDTFAFDTETKKCYKIYNESQSISPYTCLSDDVFVACVEDFPRFEGCEGIVTQNNETVILDCIEYRENLRENSCFKVYTADYTLHVTHLKKVEERCIGITTPSNLTILLECYFCAAPGITSVDGVERLRTYGTFLTTYLSNEYLGKNSYLNKSEFKAYNENNSWKIPEYLLQKSTVSGYWLPNTSCYGVTLPSNETVVLECLSNDGSKRLKRGCFEIRDQQLKVEQEQFACIKVIDKKCVGITTPMNWSVELSCYSDDYGSEYVDWHKNYENYKFNPEVGNCYEVYDSNENVNSSICKRQVNSEKQSCIKEENNCLTLKTPTNETIQFLCGDADEEFDTYFYNKDLTTCFNVSRHGESYKEVCQQEFDNNSIGITTPDNFTILFDSYLCSTSTADWERDTYSYFINTFSFNPDIKRCYKIYTEQQQISPFTCLDEDVFSSCVDQLPLVEDCEGIVTQNNETVVLHCSDDKESLQDPKCFKIYTADNNLHVACQKKVEERCIGITTPSNLTILLDCYFCIKSGVRHIPEDADRRRRSWQFVTKYLSDELLGKNSYIGKLNFKASRGVDPDFFEYSEKITTVHSHWLPNNCYGVTLDSNEIVILECISKETLGDIKPGCYQVINPETKQEQVVCSKILDEACVGLTSPMNWSVALACYTEYGKNSPDIVRDSYSGSSANHHTLFLNLSDCYEFYPSQEINDHSCTKSANPKNYGCIHWLPGERKCLGLETPADETIELACEGSYESYVADYFLTKKHCFNVYKSANHSEEICLQKFGNFSIGVTTPSNYSVLLDSFHCSVHKSPREIQKYKEFVGNFTFDPSIRSCYKVYTPDEDISPYTCLSNEIHDACIHPLENAKNCMGITTQNNETVVLQCLDGTELVNEAGCFKIYTPDSKIHTACQKQLEERCVGIVTPSNLTVLLECHTCISTKGGAGLPIYSDTNRRTYRRLIEYFLYMFTQNNYVLEDTRYVWGYTPDQDIKILDCYGEISKYEIHILHGREKCRGITLDNLETIVLECPNSKPVKAGCFDVFSPVYNEDNKIIGSEEKVANVCVKILNEWCVGITTPRNRTVTLSCFFPSAAACGVVTVPDNAAPEV